MGKLVVLRLPLDKPLISMNLGRGAHWSQIKQARDTTHLLMKAAIRKAKLTTLPTPVRITIIWFAPNRHLRDPDGLALQVKMCIDSLVKEKVIPDDNSTKVYDVTCGPVVVARDDPRLELHIRSMDGPGDVRGD